MSSSLLLIDAGPSSRKRPVKELHPGPPLSHRTTFGKSQTDFVGGNTKKTYRIIRGVIAGLKEPCRYSVGADESGCECEAYSRTSVYHSPHHPSNLRSA